MAAQQSQTGNRTTNFALACSLLSQLVKENGFAAKGNLEHLRVPATRNLLSVVEENNQETEVMNKGNILELFPQYPAALQEEKLGTPETRQQENSKLTIFYGGKVLVFDKFSAEKAEDLMQFASKASSSSAQNLAYVPPAMATKGQNHMLAQPRFPDLPQTRKASLQRFFDMRKNRIKSKAPYDVFGSPRKATSAKSEGSATWMGLASEASKCSSRNLSSDLC